LRQRTRYAAGDNSSTEKHLKKALELANDKHSKNTYLRKLESLNRESK